MDDASQHTSTSRLSADALEDVIARMREGFQVIGFDWRYLYVNDEVCRQGRKRREELLGRTMSEFYPGIEDTPLFEQLRRCMETRTPAEFENAFRHADGTTGCFELRIGVVDVGISIMSLDVTDRRQLEVQARQSQKMEAVGRLASGIAHDFNNVLTAVRTFSSLVAERVADDELARDDIAEVLRATDRATELVRQLMAFSRKQVVVPRIVDLGALLTTVRRMLDRVVGDHVEVRWIANLAPWSVRIEPGAFEQVLVNLAINARDAMPSGGTITIELDNAVVDHGHRMARGGIIAPGDYVVLAMSDQGCGMDEATAAQIFEPFFTTKEVGEGTGLGLSTCYGIVRQAGGYIWVYSELGKGTSFKVYLPRAQQADDRVAAAPSQRSLRTGTETILVVENDEQVRQVVERSLGKLGYRVVSATSGEHALTLHAGLGRVDLLLTDMVMPRMSGSQLAARIREFQPQIPVVFMSGYSEAALGEGGELDGADGLVTKPFTVEELASKLRAALDRGAGG